LANKRRSLEHSAQANIFEQFIEFPVENQQGFFVNTLNWDSLEKG
jgi:hypothetical protein